MKLHLDLRTTPADANRKAVDYVAEQSKLPKLRIKDAMSKGALWLSRGRSRRRLRKATEALKSGDRIELFYDDELLARKATTPTCLVDAGGYSVWFKPAGLVAQGNDYSDHLALTRIAEQTLTPPRPALLVHRIDRETAGLMLIAHKPGMAAALSALFSERKIAKRYRALVRGEIATSGVVDTPLDGKSAVTRFSRIGYSPERNCSLIDVEIDTGRTHQIRRHLEQIGHPLMGDPRYGEGNKNRAGLQLFATLLAFTCPIRRQPVSFELSETFLQEHSSYTGLAAEAQSAQSDNDSQP